jgi:DNA-directed RNA polymerase I subunit RPA43
MLSLVGSLQPDPFSPAHVPHQMPQTKKAFATSPSPLRFPSPSHPLQTAIEDGDGDDDDDLLAALSPSKDKSNLARNIKGGKSSDPGQGPHHEQSHPGAADDEENVDVEAGKARKAERKRKRRALAKEQAGDGGQLPGKKKKMKMKAESP